MHLFWNTLAITVFVAMLSFSSASHAERKEQSEIFKSSEFLTWDREATEFYIRTSVGMASLIVGQTDKSQGKCVDDWYYKDQTVSNAYIFDAMKRFPDYHPRGVILAAMEKKCGKFAYKK